MFEGYLNISANIYSFEENINIILLQTSDIFDAELKLYWDDLRLPIQLYCPISLVKMIIINIYSMLEIHFLNMLGLDH